MSKLELLWEKTENLRRLNQSYVQVVDGARFGNEQTKLFVFAAAWATTWSPKTTNGDR